MTSKPSAADVRSAMDVLTAYFAAGGSGSAIAQAGQAATAPPATLESRLSIFPYKAASESAKALAKALDVLRLFPYKAASESAKALAKALDVLRLKREGSTYSGKSGQFILNWGAGTGNFNANVGQAKVLNPPALVDRAINKKSFFETMLGVDGPRVPFWTTDAIQARQWLNMGHIVIARDELEGSKGAGIRVMKSSLDFRTGKLYTIHVPSITEYRVYVFDGNAVDAREKRIKTGQTPDTNNMRYDETKYLFCEHVANSSTTRIFPGHLPADVKLQAEKAAKKLGLLTGGIDVLWDGTKAFVLEYNTAPYLGDHTTAIYAKLLKEYVAQAA